MYFARVFTLRIKAKSVASIGVTKGVGGVNPLNNFIYNLNNKIVTKYIYSYVWKNKKIISR